MTRRKLYLMRSFFLGIVLVCATCSQGLAQNDSKLRERFFGEAPQRWEEYSRFTKRLQLTVDTSRYTTTNGERSPTERLRTEYKQNKSAALRVIQSLEPVTTGQVEGVNPSYSFVLNQADANRGWVLTDLKLLGHSEGQSGKEERLQEDVTKDVCNVLTVWNLWLPDLIRDPDFKIKAIRPHSYDGEECVLIDFDYPKSKESYPRKGAVLIKGGSIILDPKHDWILRDYSVHLGNPNEVTYNKKFDIREGKQQHPIVVAIKTHISVKDDKTTEIFSESKCQAEERSDLPLSEFTLSAFGLPEPMGAAPLPQSHTWLWLLAATVAAVALAVLFAWLKRRHTRTIARSSNAS